MVQSTDWNVPEYKELYQDQIEMYRSTNGCVKIQLQSTNVCTGVMHRLRRTRVRRMVSSTDWIVPEYK